MPTILRDGNPVVLIILAMVGLSIPPCLLAIRFRLRIARELRRRLDAWAIAEGLKLNRAWMVGPLSLPKGMRSQLLTAGGVAFFRFHAVGADGRPRSGYVGLPIQPGRFAPEVRVAWDPAGPVFDGSV